MTGHSVKQSSEEVQAKKSYARANNDRGNGDEGGTCHELERDDSRENFKGLREAIV